jgi:hypothetical protein
MSLPAQMYEKSKSEGGRLAGTLAYSMQKLTLLAY